MSEWHTKWCVVERNELDEGFDVESKRQSFIHHLWALTDGSTCICNENDHTVGVVTDFCQLRQLHCVTKYKWLLSCACLHLINSHSTAAIASQLQTGALTVYCSAAAVFAALSTQDSIHYLLSYWPALLFATAAPYEYQSIDQLLLLACLLVTVF